MRVSLVLATVNRVDEISRFLAHMDRQSFRDFELIVVDSNPDPRLVPLVEKYRDRFSLTYVKCPQGGASKARNLGLTLASGGIIGFPDDDCWYSPELLAEVNRWFEQNPDKQGLICRAVSAEDKTVVSRYGKKGKPVNRYGIWKCSSTFTMFHRVEALPGPPAFKEELGVGAGTPWGAAEDTQLLFDILAGNHQVIYNPVLTVFHPDPFTYAEDILIHRGFSYGAGLGYVMGINGYPRWFFIYYLLRSIGGTVLAIFSGSRRQVLHNLQTFRGRLYGWKAAHSRMS